MSKKGAGGEVRGASCVVQGAKKTGMLQDFSWQIHPSKH